MSEAEQSRLGENILLFCRTLRAAGVPVGPAQVIDALRAVVEVGVERRDDLRAALRATLLNDPSHLRLFDQTFHVYFRNPRLLERVLGLLLPGGRRQGESAEQTLRRLAEALAEPRKDDDLRITERKLDREGSYSATERLREKDFEGMSLAEQREAARLLRAELPALAETPGRRFRQHPLGRRPDLRRSMQLMIRRDGQLLTLIRKKRRLRTPALVLICDISGSMSRYSRMFLHFAHAMTARPLTVHTFVFGTRLTNVTRRLRVADADEALERVSGDVRDFDGGTRIADCLRHFNRVWGRRVLAGNAVVVLLSDGLERDTESDLEFQIARLHRSCRQLIWLNPMLRYADFEPRAFGIRTLLPHVDLFLPAHNIRSLAELTEILSSRSALQSGGIR